LLLPARSAVAGPARVRRLIAKPAQVARRALLALYLSAVQLRGGKAQMVQGALKGQGKAEQLLSYFKPAAPRAHAQTN